MVVTNAYPRLRDARVRAERRQAESCVTTLNYTVQRCVIDWQSGAGVAGNDKDAALAFYIANGYLQNPDTVSVANIDFVDGIWVSLLPPS